MHHPGAHGTEVMRQRFGKGNCQGCGKGSNDTYMPGQRSVAVISGSDDPVLLGISTRLLLSPSELTVDFRGDDSGRGSGSCVQKTADEGFRHHFDPVTDLQT